jgi:hypothetical protein
MQFILTFRTVIARTAIRPTLLARRRQLASPFTLGQPHVIRPAVRHHLDAVAASAGRSSGAGSTTSARKGAKLVPEPTEPDLYIDEAYRLWAIKQQSKR